MVLSMIIFYLLEDGCACRVKLLAPKLLSLHFALFALHSRSVPCPHCWGLSSGHHCWRRQGTQDAAGVLSWSSCLSFGRFTGLGQIGSCMFVYMCVHSYRVFEGIVQTPC